MATQSLQQVIKSLNSIYSPQVNLLRQKQAGLTGQLQAEESGLAAKQTQAYDDIVNGARRRGLGFAGIPLAEQAKYNSTEYMPALARLRQQSKDQAMSLEEAILGVRERQQGAGMSYWQALDARDKWQREFDENKRRFELQLAESRAAASRGGGGGGFTPSFGGGGGGNAPAQSTAAGVPASLQSLYNRMFIRPDGAMWSDADLRRDFDRTRISAGYGNATDKQKLQLYYSARPDLFRMTGSSLGNAPRF